MAEDTPRRRKAKTKEEGRAPMPEYKVEPVNELPAGYEPGTSPGRGMLYHKLLTQILEEGEKDQWYEIASFSSGKGAVDAARELRKGNRDIPDGNWEFRGIRLPDGEHSKLFVKLA